MRRANYVLLVGLVVSGCAQTIGRGCAEMGGARIKANEEVAQQLCNVYAETLRLYRKNTGHYPLSFTQLYDEGYLSPSDPYNRLILQAHPAQGYYYSYHYVDDNHFILEAGPAEKGVTGNQIFTVDESGVTTGSESQ